MENTQRLCYNCFAQRESLEGPCPYCGFDLAENQQKFPVALRAGTILNNRYIVGRVLGQGGFGITYLAFDTQLQAKVAVKEYMPNDISTRIDGTTVSVAMETKADDFTYGSERFQEEARTLAKFIGHPNIAGVSSYFDENGTSYFVMDYIEGVSFKSYIANNGGRVSVEETLNVMIPVLRALTAVHAEGFIHRDVTPDNIYISKDGNVKLLDFGSARYSIGDKSKSLDVILKVGYAPKEQYIRRGRQGPFTDVYSCAACFYAALTGYLPPESLERLDHDELAPVSQVLPDIPEWLDKAILKGLAVQPEDRFQSAAEFLSAIENQIAVDVPVSGGQSPQPEAKKPKTALIAGIAAALAVVIGVGAFMAGRGGKEEPPQDGQVQNSGQGNQDISAVDTPPEPEAFPLTIAGQEVLLTDEALELTGVALTDADIAEMKKMSGLKSIFLNRVALDTNGLDWVAAFPQLTEFSYEGYLTGEVDLTLFAALTEMTVLNIRDSYNNGLKVIDLSPIAGLTKMKQLGLPLGPEVTNLDALAGMTEMTFLTLLAPETNISSLEPLSGMTKMERLDLEFNQIDTGLAGLENLTNLTNATLRFNFQEDNAPSVSLEPIAGWKKVMNLMIDTNIEDQNITPLAGLTDLRTLDVHTRSHDSPIQSLEPLRGLTKLQSLSISHVAKGIDQSPVEHVPSVEVW